jgi:hypothetical protein
MSLTEDERPIAQPSVPASRQGNSLFSLLEDQVLGELEVQLDLAGWKQGSVSLIEVGGQGRGLEYVRDFGSNHLTGGQIS